MSESSVEIVKVYDFETKSVYTIPASELTGGMVRVKFEETGEVFWADSSQLQPSEEFRHPPFTGVLREKIHFIKESLSEVYPKSYEEWEDGFRLDSNAQSEIEIWVRLAECHIQAIQSRGITSAERGQVFQVLVACLNSTPTTAHQILPPLGLSKDFVREIVDSYFNT